MNFNARTVSDEEVARSTEGKYPSLAISAENKYSSAEPLLQASRRVDWRFLLPDPNLGRVAYLGSKKSPLAASLRLFSKSLTVMDSPVGTGYDGVVVSATKTGLPPETAVLLRPGGFLYLEIYGTSWWARQGKFKIAPHLNSYVTSLTQLGFSHVRAYWHWPNFETCTRIISLNDLGSLLFVLAPRQQGMFNRFKTKLVQELWRSGLLARLVPCFSLIAQRVP